MTSPRALLFDVFGTVVDWRGSLIRNVTQVADRDGIEIPAGRLADEWRHRYGPSMQRVLDGDLPWMNLDELQALTLGDIATDWGLGLTPDQIEELTACWHRLDPWPDAVAGLHRLKEHFILATMSNGNVALLVNMARHAGLPWDALLSAELARRYKRDLESYRFNIALLGLQPEDTMMVAAHGRELAVVATIGMRTAYIQRPHEWGEYDPERLDPGCAVDYLCSDIGDLADQLGLP